MGLEYVTSGNIPLRNNLAVFAIPAGFKYLDAEQSQYVLTELWGNPPSETLGMIFPGEAGDTIPDTWAVEISYEEDGHVKDDDARNINYDDLLKQMQESAEQSNQKRKELGFPTYQLLGWASAPYYDEKAKKLHWAKRLLFEGDSEETLNYNIRVLGRKGVLVLNVIGQVEQLEEIKKHVPAILNSINFTPGNRYEDFDSNIDKVAAYGIGGLIAGGVLAKTGLLAKIGIIFAKFAKVIIAGAAIIIAAIVKFFTGKKKDEQAQS
ncbi:MAG: DUF2167 domain-containing protein [Chitinophagales bacterium]|nr:DUF2167 domain-containing protein [Chitinophagales bacterium]